MDAAYTQRVLSGSRRKPTGVLLMVINALVAPKSLQFSSMRFKSNSVQSLSKKTFVPTSIIFCFLPSSSSSSSLSLNGPMLTRPRNSAGEKDRWCSAGEDTGNMPLPGPHCRLSRLLIYRRNNKITLTENVTIQI